MRIETRVEHPINQDCIIIYRVKYEDDGRKFYGGVGLPEEWHEFKTFDCLSMNVPGVLILDGLEALQLAEGLKRLEASLRDRMRMAYQMLGEILAEGTSNGDD